MTCRKMNDWERVLPVQSTGKAKTEYWMPTGNETQYFVQGYLFLFDFDKGLLMNNDRFIYSAVFKKKLEEIGFTRDKAEIVNLLCEMMKHSNRLISYSLIKKKITSNLKNFKCDLMLGQSKSFDEMGGQSQRSFSQSQLSLVNQEK